VAIFIAFLYLLYPSISVGIYQTNHVAGTTIAVISAIMFEAAYAVFYYCFNQCIAILHILRRCDADVTPGDVWETKEEKGADDVDSITGEEKGDDDVDSMSTNESQTSTSVTTSV
jgi:hypothetical protein